ERRELGRLQHHSIAGGERRGNLPAQHQEREVPGDDLAADAPWRVLRKAALEMLGPAGMMVEVPGRERDVDVTALADGLAVVEALEHGEEAGMLLDGAGEGIEIARPLIAGKRAPGGEG